MTDLKTDHWKRMQDVKRSISKAELSRAGIGPVDIATRQAEIAQLQADIAAQLGMKRIDKELIGSGRRVTETDAELRQRCIEAVQGTPTHSGKDRSSPPEYDKLYEPKQKYPIEIGAATGKDLDRAGAAIGLKRLFPMARGESDKSYRERLMHEIEMTGRFNKPIKTPLKDWLKAGEND